MSDPSKVLLFGSFTENETRSWISGKKENPCESREKGAVKISSSEAVQPQAIDGSVGGRAFSVQKGKTEPQRNSATSAFSNAHENGNTSISKSHVEKKVIFGGAGLSRRASDENFVSNLQNSDNIKLNGSNAASPGDVLQNSKRVTGFHGQDVLPCGLINPGNLCFLNATLQALLSCSPFVRLLQELRSRNLSKAAYPTISAFVDFINEVSVVGGINVADKDPAVIETRKSYTPVMFETVLRKFSPDISGNFLGRTRQEDAQEFLSFMMDQMHDELLKLDGLTVSKSTVVSTAEDDGWETIGPKNKSAVTTTQSLIPSELSSIFGGQLRSVVKAKGNKASATVQPFLMLHLDISHESIRTVEDALHFFSAPETLNEYRTPTSQRAAPVSARKSINIQSLPKILILHLKRFGYGAHGSTKLQKAVRFPLALVLHRDLLVSAAVEGRKYELVATITHHGNIASKGHYTADARRNDGLLWLRFDDASVEAIPRSRVLHDHAYLLFYRQV